MTIPTMLIIALAVVAAAAYVVDRELARRRVKSGRSGRGRKR
jgi:hypothetical protein